MAIKKSELYASLWASCNELRGGMEASEYKDYVLVMLFVKYISDKYAGQPYAPITVPEGASFEDMRALKENPHIGEYINKKIIGPIANANRLSDMPDFDDKNKLGNDEEMVGTLTNLIAIFEDSRLDFSKNRADGDDILGDAYEYLMRHFASESGKSKGQFYTPSEVSQVMSKIIGITPENSSPETTAYDPTCGSGSLLLKIAEQAEKSISLYGQEKEAATTGLARMNMVLHNQPTALQSIVKENTLTNPQFLKEDGSLRKFDYVVANPPFSDKRWSNGLTPDKDRYGRFQDFGIPPVKNGDYAYLLHILHSLKRKGKGTCILPHGVLFRGHSETEIRKNLVKGGYIKGIIGLPENMFYGTGIPACIVVLDKENAQNRKGIFMIDASKGFMKDGPKNRLRSMDIHKIVDVFKKSWEIEGYSRVVPLNEIEANEYNLNIPRYIDSQEEEDLQDIQGHLNGEIPQADIDALQEYWTVYPSLRPTLFEESSERPYAQLKVDKEAVKDHIFNHPEFKEYAEKLASYFTEWQETTTQYLKALAVGCNPKQIIHDISEDLLRQYSNRPLVNRYNVYQHLMDYWAGTMQDDCYLIAAEGWKAETYRVIERDKKNKEKDKGWACELVPRQLIVNRYFPEDQQTIEQLQNKLEEVSSEKSQLEEENNTEDGAFWELDKLTKGRVEKRLKAVKAENAQIFPAAEPEGEYGDETLSEEAVLEKWLTLYQREKQLKDQLKKAEKQLDQKAYDQYPKLTEDEIKTLVVEDKWMTALEAAIRSEMDAISQRLTQRIKELAERYEEALGDLDAHVKDLENKVNGHLEKMGFEWN